MAYFDSSVVEAVCEEFSDRLSRDAVNRGFNDDHDRHREAAMVCLRVATLRSFLLLYEKSSILNALDTMDNDPDSPSPRVDLIERAAMRLAFLLDGERNVG